MNSRKKSFCNYDGMNAKKQEKEKWSIKRCRTARCRIGIRNFTGNYYIMYCERNLLPEEMMRKKKCIIPNVHWTINIELHTLLRVAI